MNGKNLDFTSKKRKSSSGLAEGKLPAPDFTSVDKVMLSFNAKEPRSFKKSPAFFRSPDKAHTSLKKQNSCGKNLFGEAKVSRKLQFDLSEDSSSPKMLFKLNKMENENSVTINLFKKEEQPLSVFEGEFDCLTKIAEGDFGEVFKCLDKNTGEIVAVKVGIRSSSKAEKERMMQIIEDQSKFPLLFQLKHLRCWEENFTFYLSTEFCTFGSLESFLFKLKEAEIEINEELVDDLIFQLFESLHSLHAMGYAHLDIKPDNILVDEKGYAKLGDYGLSRKLPTTSYVDGDSRYLPLEALNINPEQITTQIDLFSLGMTILDLLYCVELPSQGQLWTEIRSGAFDLDKLNVGSPLLNPVPIKYKTLILQLTSPNPLERGTTQFHLSTNYFLQGKHTCLQYNQYEPLVSKFLVNLS